MKVQDRPRETLDRLPELPDDVVVPDDVSGLTHPPAGRKVAGGVRWMRWLVALVVLAIGAGAVTYVILQEDEIDYVERATGSDRHLVTVGELTTAPVVVDSMDLYGTDNPAFPMMWVRDLGSDRHLTTMRDLRATGVDLMEVYGTDNPAFVTTSPTAVPTLGSDRHLETMRDLGGAARTMDSMELYGTDNPAFVTTP